MTTIIKTTAISVIIHNGHNNKQKTITTTTITLFLSNTLITRRRQKQHHYLPRTGRTISKSPLKDNNIEVMVFMPLRKDAKGQAFGGRGGGAKALNSIPFCYNDLLDERFWMDQTAAP